MNKICNDIAKQQKLTQGLNLSPYIIIILPITAALLRNPKNPFL